MTRSTIPPLGDVVPPLFIGAATVFTGSQLDSFLMVTVVILVVVAVVVSWASVTFHDRGLPAPDAAQRLSAELANLLEIRPLPVTVSTDEVGVASLCGFGRRRHIRMAPSLLEHDEATIRAVVAHEYAHAVLHHQWWSVSGLVAVWTAPLLVTSAAVRFAGLPVAVGCGAASLLIVIGLGSWRTGMRSQELAADSWAAKIPGVEAAMIGYLTVLDVTTATSSAASTSRESRLHPSASTRLGRLRGRL